MEAHGVGSILTHEVIPRGFPQDRPIRPGNSLDLDWFVTQRNLIRIWAPEGITANGKLQWFLLREPPPITWAPLGTEGWESRFEIPGRCGVVTRARPRDDGIDLELDATNLGTMPWTGTRLTVCVQLAAAPDFRDPGLERTYHPTPQGWQKFARDEVRDSVPPGRCTFYGTAPAPGTGEAGPAEIRVGSVCGKWHLAHWFCEARGVIGNCQPGFCCVHANPELGTVAPGATATARGGVRVRRGAVDERGTP